MKLAHEARSGGKDRDRKVQHARTALALGTEFHMIRSDGLRTARRLELLDSMTPWCPTPLVQATEDAALDSEAARLERRNEVVLHYAAADPECPLTLEEFFVGNTEDDSIAPNLMGDEHPGIETFRAVLYEVRAQDLVADVRVGIHELPTPGAEGDDDIWIAAGPVYVWAEGVGVEEVRGWFEPLPPDWVAEVGEGPPCRPAPGEGLRVFRAVWD